SEIRRSPPESLAFSLLVLDQPDSRDTPATIAWRLLDRSPGAVCPAVCPARSDSARRPRSSTVRPSMLPAVRLPLPRWRRTLGLAEPPHRYDRSSAAAAQSRSVQPRGLPPGH